MPEVRFSGRVEKVVLKGASEAQVAFNEVSIGDESLLQLRNLQNTGEEGTTVEVLVGICPPAQMSFNYDVASGDSVGDRVAKLAGALTIYEGVLKGIGGDPGPAPTGDGAAVQCSACLAHRALAASVLAEVRELLGGQAVPIEDGKVRVYRVTVGEAVEYSESIEHVLTVLEAARKALDPKWRTSPFQPNETDRSLLRDALQALTPGNSYGWEVASVEVDLMTREEADKFLADPPEKQAVAWMFGRRGNPGKEPAQTPATDDDEADDDPGRVAG